MISLCDVKVKKKVTMKMIMPKTLFTLMTMVVVCAGCVSDPFIAESIVKLDSAPGFCKLPEGFSKDVQVLPKEKLLGEWNSGIVEMASRHIDGHGIYDSGTHIENKQYVFFDDDSYIMANSHGVISKGRYGEILGEVSYISLQSRGKWSYENGLLTLNTQYYNLEVKAGEKLISKKSESCNRTNVFKVKCYANGDISIDEANPQHDSSNSESNRKLVSIDKYGVKTERTIKVTGMRDGKEIGVIDEKIVPPMRFKREKKRN